MCLRFLFKKQTKNEKNYNEQRLQPQPYYQKKRYFMTPTEQKVYFSLLEATYKTNLIVFPQINLATIIKKMNSKYQNELYRNIDFGIFDKNTFEPLLMIELNDISHAQPQRAERDAKVKEILSSCYLPLLTIYTDKPNKPDYLRQRIFNEIRY